jgi:anti-anti-sigma factor
MDYTMNVSRNGDHTLIRLSGELTIKHARKIATQLSEISDSTIVIELNDPESTDLSFIQVLAAWLNHLHKAGAQVRLKASLKEPDKTLLTKSGFANFFHTYDTNL